jgi:hypothetical protein
LHISIQGHVGFVFIGHSCSWESSIK